MCHVAVCLCYLCVYITHQTLVHSRKIKMWLVGVVIKPAVSWQWTASRAAHQIPIALHMEIVPDSTWSVSKFLNRNNIVSTNWSNQIDWNAKYSRNCNQIISIQIAFYPIDAVAAQCLATVLLRARLFRIRYFIRACLRYDDDEVYNTQHMRSEHAVRVYTIVPSIHPSMWWCTQTQCRL